MHILLIYMYINCHHYRFKLTHKAFNAYEVELVFSVLIIRESYGTDITSEHKKKFF